MIFVARPFASSRICKSCVGSRSGARALALSIGTSMLLDPVTRTESGSAGPAQQAATLLSYAGTSRSGPAKPSVDVFGQVRNQSGMRIEEVSLERTRVSRKYRSHLDNALGFLLLWVTGTIWATVEWAKADPDVVGIIPCTQHDRSHCRELLQPVH